MLRGLRCESSSFATRGRVVAAALDESGSRCVTAADDRQELHVLERDGDAWRSCCAPWRAHDAPLRGVAWASAVFGSMLASCGDDGVRVWAVLPGEQAKLLATLGVAEHAAAVVCVAFGPQHLGLRLAAGGADGVVRLYAAQDRTSGWEEEGAFEAGAACTSLAWCLHGPGRPAALAVGIAGAAARVWAFDSELRRWSGACELSGGAATGVMWARNDGRAWELLAVSSGARVVVWRVTFHGVRVAAEAAAEPFMHGDDVCSMDWDFTGTRLAVAARDGRVRLWSAELDGEWGEYSA